MVRVIAIAGGIARRVWTHNESSKDSYLRCGKLFGCWRNEEEGWKAGEEKKGVRQVWATTAWWLPQSRRMAGVGVILPLWLDAATGWQPGCSSSALPRGYRERARFRAAVRLPPSWFR